MNIMSMHIDLQHITQLSFHVSALMIYMECSLRRLDCRKHPLAPPDVHLTSITANNYIIGILQLFMNYVYLYYLFNTFLCISK